MKKKIKVKFVDFWPNYDIKNHMIYKSIIKKYDVILSDDPDYLFYSVFGNDNLNYNDCIKIFYTAENISPDFNLCDYAIGFDYIDFGDRYLRLPNFYNQSYEKSFSNIMNKKNGKEILDRKTDFCCFVYSNNKADIYREKLYNAINEYKNVKSGGRFNNNIGRFIDDKIEFQKEFKFCIACENSSYPGYTTEKILDAFASYTIPIYWGDTDITKVFNEKAFINCNNCRTFDEVVKKIKEIDEDDQKYINMINEPIFVNNSFYQNKQLELLDQFLYNIFDQDKKVAYRYNRSFYRKMYLEERLDSIKAYKRTFKYNLKQLYVKIRLLRLRRKK